MEVELQEVVIDPVDYDFAGIIQRDLKCVTIVLNVSDGRIAPVNRWWVDCSVPAQL